MLSEDRKKTLYSELSLQPGRSGPGNPLKGRQQLGPSAISLFHVLGSLSFPKQ